MDELVHEVIATHPHLADALNNAVATYDQGTFEHNRRVGICSRQVGEVLGLDRGDLSVLAWAGSLHDLGKLSVPEGILHKPGALSEDEWDVVRNHPTVGGQVLMALSPDLEPIAQAVEGHHERWDGSGYPDALVGPDIPLFARVVSLADVYDALTIDDRLYRQAHIPADRAREMIKEMSGTHFDPALVPAFLEVVEPDPRISH